MNKTALYIPAYIAIILIWVSCDRDRNNPGYDYFPDMAYSKAYETYDPSSVLRDSMTLQAPVYGTVSRESENYPYPRSEEGMHNAVSIKNPFSPDSLYIARGRQVYENICLNCHGVNADGQGHLFVSGKYLYPPANLMSEKIVNRADGQLYHAITMGYGIMEPHGVIVRPEDRWKVVLYIRKLQSGLKPIEQTKN
jgi:hypothetical protein